MVSGRQTLATIDQAVTQAQAKAATVEAQIEAVNRQLAAQHQAQTADYKALAQVRLGLLADAAMVQRLDETQQQVKALLARRETALTELQGQLETAEGTERALAAERATQAATVDAAAGVVDTAEAQTQARLDADPAYQAQRERARETELRAGQSAEKATRSAEEREQKGASYRADPLFMYLWERKFGQPGYRAWGLTRWLDGKVARLIGFLDARANYDRLNEIPERLRDHAEGLKAQAESEFAVLRSMDEAARAADGIAAPEERLAAEQAKLDAIDRRIAQAASDRQALQVRKALYAVGEDEHTKAAVELLSAELQRDDLMDLRRAALASPTPDDDLIVARLMQRDDEGRRLAASIQGLREALAAQQQRLGEAEALRADFKTNRYDRAGSSFGDEAMIAMMLGQFVNGILDRRQLWRVLQEQQRYQPERSDPGFGSGGFGRGTVWGGGGADLRDLGDIVGRMGGGGGWGGGGGRGGGSSGGGGGGFRTGGGF